MPDKSSEWVVFDEKVYPCKSPYYEKENPDGGPYFLFIGKFMPSGYQKLKVPWGQMRVNPMELQCLPEGFWNPQDLLETVQKCGTLYVIAKGLGKLPVDEQKRIAEPYILLLKDKHVFIKDGNIVKSNKVIEAPEGVMCPKCRLTHETLFCPICGTDLETVRKDVKKTSKVTPPKKGKGAEPKVPPEEEVITVLKRNKGNQSKPKKAPKKPKGGK